MSLTVFAVKNIQQFMFIPTFLNTIINIKTEVCNSYLIIIISSSSFFCITEFVNFALRIKLENIYTVCLIKAFGKSIVDLSDNIV